MITYLDLLPYDIFRYYEKKVDELYLKIIKKKKMIYIFLILLFWLIALWGAGFGKNNVVKNLYSSTQKNQEITC